MAVTAESKASSLTLTSVDQSESLELVARFLPYRPLTIGGKQRAEFTWYPGSPSATVQMLGPEEMPISMNGFWKERFIYNPQAGGWQAKYNNEPVVAVMDLVKLVDQMRRSGRLYRFAWDEIQRFGHIVDFEVQWHNRFDVEWSIEFAVTAQEQEAAAQPTNSASALTIAGAINAAFVEYPDWLRPGVELPFNLFGFLDVFLAFIAQLEDLLLEYQNLVTRFANGIADLVLNPVDAIRGLIAGMTRSINAITATVNNITNRALEAYFYFAGGQDESPIGSQVSAASLQNDVGIWGDSIAGATVFQRYDLQTQMQQETTPSFVAPNDMDFRDVATQFYGSQDGWIRLRDYNGYDTSRISAGDLIWVPPQPTSGSLGSGGSY